jgi:hypothetical protein
MISMVISPLSGISFYPNLMIVNFSGLARVISQKLWQYALHPSYFTLLVSLTAARLPFPLTSEAKRRIKSA